MKKFLKLRVLTFVLLSTSMLTGQQASLLAVYEVRSVRDVESIDSKEAQDLVYQSNDMLKTFEFELYLNNNEALFKKVDYLLGDNDKEYIYNLALAFCDGEKVWYTNVAEDVQVALTESLEEPIVLTIEQKLDWQITGNSKVIGDYNVYEATTSRTEGKAVKSITAWFSKELPYNFGPLGIGGLPGLIVEVQVWDMLFTIKNLEKNTSKIKRPKGNGTLAFQEFYKRLDDEMESIMARGY